MNVKLVRVSQIFVVILLSALVGLLADFFSKNQVFFDTAVPVIVEQAGH